MPLVGAEHVECGGLALTLRDDPMLDADRRAPVRVGPADDVAGSEAGRAAAADHDIA